MQTIKDHPDINDRDSPSGPHSIPIYLGLELLKRLDFVALGRIDLQNVEPNLRGKMVSMKFMIYRDVLTSQTPSIRGF